jgi:hypothetical protein
MKDLSGKTVYELEREDFEKLFCWDCKDYRRCSKDQRTIVVCKFLVDSGIFDRHLRRP